MQSITGISNSSKLFQNVQSSNVTEVLNALDQFALVMQTFQTEEREA